MGYNPTMETCRAYLLGPLEISRGEQPIDLPNSLTSRSLLAYLIYHPIEMLAETLTVSSSTIKRDLAALRKDGHNVQTRGSRS